MLIVKESVLTKKKNSMDLDVTEEQMAKFNSKHRRPIYEIFPDLTPAEREFILTGITAEEWKEYTTLPVETQ